MELSIVPARRLPASQLCWVINTAFSDYIVPAATFTEPFYEQWTRRNDICPDSSLVALDGRQPVALLLIGRRGRRFWFGILGVVPSHRRRGIGRELMTLGLAAAREEQAQIATIDVIQGNYQAIALYVGLGFRVRREVALLRKEGNVLAGPLSAVPPLTIRRGVAAEVEGLGGCSIERPWQSSAETMWKTPRTLSLIALARGEAVGALCGRVMGSTERILSHLYVLPCARQQGVGTALLGQFFRSAPGARFTRVPDVPVNEDLAFFLRHGFETVVRLYEMEYGFTALD